MIVKTMGAPGGWLATFGGLAGGADFVITSSEVLNPKELLTTIQHRYESGKRFSIVVVEDGVKLPEEIIDECKCSHETDPAEVVGIYIGKNSTSMEIYKPWVHSKRRNACSNGQNHCNTTECKICGTCENGKILPCGWCKRFHRNRGALQ